MKCQIDHPKHIKCGHAGSQKSNTPKPRASKWGTECFPEDLVFAEKTGEKRDP